jgi:2,4-dienoyl-CoA reductase-like NADH-dependent reductase (Old Yellow Enzyme family)/thioredoxin reductase
MKRDYTHLLEPGGIGRMRLKNRVIFGPCETLYATVDGEVTQKIIDYYVRRARGGASLLVVHSAQACTRLDPIDPFPNSLRVDDNAYVPMLSELTEHVHRAGSKIAILVSAGGGAASMGFPYDRGAEGIGETTNLGVGDRMSLVARRTVRTLSTDEVKQFVKLFGLAARRVALAGFDAMYIHALAYLTSQFMSPLWNNRDDEYGRDRMRFILELVDACRENAGPDFPLIVRMAIDEYFPGGVTAEQGVQNAKRLADAGVSAIDCMAGVYESMHYIVPPVYLPKGVLVNLAEAVKKEVKIPVITQGRLYDPEIAEGVLRDGKADFIQMARGLLADPDWVRKVEQGREADIRKCISCNRCFDRILKAQPIRCAINPVAGREGEFDETPSPAPRRKKVVIVGAGPAGMEAARVCAEKGHKVTLFEKTKELAGGQISLAAHAPGKDEFLNVVTYYKARFKKLRNVKVVLNKNASLADIKREAPDAVILATGAGPMIPEIDGIHGRNVITIADVMSGKAKLKGKIVIAGGGCAGIDCANYLSSQNLNVTVVEALNECALDEELITRLTLLYSLGQRPNLTLMTGHTIARITAEGVWARGQAQPEQLIPADHVVVALGFVSHNPLEASVRKHVKQCAVIGDARQPGKIMEAVSAGFFAAEDV